MLGWDWLESLLNACIAAALAGWLARTQGMGFDGESVKYLQQFWLAGTQVKCRAKVDTLHRIMHRIVHCKVHYA